jgi:hypothetical protein
MVQLELHCERAAAAAAAPPLPAAVADIVRGACDQPGQPPTANSGVILHLEADGSINSESPRERRSRLKVRPHVM